MAASNFPMVDNEDFIDWASTSPNPEFPEDKSVVAELGDGVKQKFYSKDGATPIETVQQLESALIEMFWHRVDSQLEVAAVMGLFGPPDTSTCSEETQTAAWEIFSDYQAGLSVGIDLMNMSPFLKRVADSLPEPCLV